MFHQLPQGWIEPAAVCVGALSGLHRTANPDRSSSREKLPPFLGLSGSTLTNSQAAGVWHFWR